MAKKTEQLLLTIEQNGKVFHHRLNKDRFTVGKHPNNDITVYSEQYPRRHVLFEKRNHHYQLAFKKFMKGEVVAKRSRLTFEDLLVHNLLPRKDDNYVYPITRDKQGHVYIGDAKISFRVVTEPVKELVDPRIENFHGYSWALATLKDLGRDLTFKAILLVVIVFNVFLVSAINKMPVKPRNEATLPKVPDRFARIIVRNPAAESPTDLGKGAVKAREARKKEGEEAKRNRSEKGTETVRPESQGVLGLLTGTGSTGQSNSLTEFLLDKGLARELESVMNTSDLDIGMGSNSGDLDLDALIATSELGGGIDDIVEEVDEVEGVELGEKGQIQVDQISGMSGSQEALGQRSEESVRLVLAQYTGRLTYIYNKYLKHNPELRGKIVVEVEIGANGRVLSARVVTSTMNHPEFEREILNFIRRWRYEPIDAGTVTVTYPLFFAPAQ